MPRGFAIILGQIVDFNDAHHCAPYTNLIVLHREKKLTTRKYTRYYKT